MRLFLTPFPGVEDIALPGVHIDRRPVYKGQTRSYEIAMHMIEIGQRLVDNTHVTRVSSTTFHFLHLLSHQCLAFSLLSVSCIIPQYLKLNIIISVPTDLFLPCKPVDMAVP
jgi:hypothetical protein